MRCVAESWISRYTFGVSRDYSSEALEVGGVLLFRQVVAVDCIVTHPSLYSLHECTGLSIVTSRSLP